MTNQPSLIDLYLDDVASADQVAQLEQWINQSDEIAAEFLRCSFDHYQLRSLLVAQENASLIECEEKASGAVDWESLLKLEADAETSGPVDITQRLMQEKREAERMKLEAYRLKFPQPKPKPHQTRAIVIPIWSIVFGIAALVALAVTPLFMIFGNATPPSNQSHTDSNPPIEIAPTAIVLATLESSIHAKWEGNLQPTLGSGEMTPGTYRLAQGTARLYYDQGVEVIVQGPATFKLVDATEIDLTAGQLGVLVSTIEGRGFAVNTDAMRIVDLGTEFGVVAEASGRVSAHVYQGVIDVYDAHATVNGDVPTAQLQVGEAVIAAHRDAALTVDVADDLAVVRSFEYEARHRVEQGTATGYERWLAWSMQVQRDPTVFAYYPFDNRVEQPDVLLNRAAATQGTLDGQFGNTRTFPLSQPQWTEGRWPRKEALNFRSAEMDHILIPHDEASAFNALDQVTVACWVRVSDVSKVHHLVTKRDMEGDSLNFVWVGGQSATGVGDSFGGGQREYSILGNFRRPAPGRQWSAFESRSVLADQDDWVMLTVTYDGTWARFYLNDQSVGAYHDTAGIQATDADLLIGGVSVHLDPLAFLDGEMDELVIWGRALDQNELSVMYEMGRTR